MVNPKISEKDRIAAYQCCFATRDGQKVLEDLEYVCLAHPTLDIIDISPHTTGFNVGLHAVWKYIQKQLAAKPPAEKQEYAQHETTAM